MRRHIRGLHEADQSAARSVRDGLLLVRVERAHHQWSSRKPFYLVRFSILDGQGFDCATWLHKARQMPKEEFRHEVEKELTGQDTEPVEIIYFKLYKSQVPVVEQAIGTAALMLGSDRSRGYCLEMICADFLAGANLAGC